MNDDTFRRAVRDGLFELLVSNGINVSASMHNECHLYVDGTNSHGRLLIRVTNDYVEVTDVENYKHKWFHYSDPQQFDKIVAAVKRVPFNG